MCAKRIRLGFVLLVAPHVALAYRPFDSTDAAVASPKEIEIEFGPVAYTDSRHASITDAPVVTVNVGLVDRWEAVIDATRVVTRSRFKHDTETVETALMLKRVLRDGVLQERTGWSTATEFGVLFPTVHSDDDYGATLALIGSRAIGHTMIHLNAELAENRDGNAELFGGLIVEAMMSMPVRPVAELTFEYERGTDTRNAGVLVGAIWERSDNLSFDIAARAVCEDHDWSYESRIGITWVFAAARK